MARQRTPKSSLNPFQFRKILRGILDKLRNAETNKARKAAYAEVEKLVGDGRADHGDFLNEALRIGDQTLCQLLIGYVGDVDAEYRLGRPMEVAARAANKEAVEMLLREGADIKLGHGKHNNAMVYHMFEGTLNPEGIGDTELKKRQAEFLKYLAGRGIDLLAGTPPELGAKQGDKGITPLELAVEYDNLACVRFLLKKGADVNPDNESNRNRPLMCRAGKFANALVTQALVNAGADVRASEPDGTQAVHYAAEYFDRRTLGILSGAGADINAVDGDGRTPLYRAVEYRGRSAETQADRVKTVRKLMAMGARTDGITHDGESVLGMAMRRHDAALIRLLANQESVNVAGRYGMRPLHTLYAMYQHATAFTEDDKIEIYRKMTGALLACDGVDVNAVDLDGRTPLFNAIRALRHQDGLESVSALLKKGADVNAVDKDGRTPLMSALMKDRKDLVELLLKQGARANVADSTGATPLHCAAARSDFASARLLIKAGCDVNAPDSNGNTAMMVTFRNTHVQDQLMMIDTLVKQGADVDAVNNKGETVLYRAAGYDNPEVVERLIQNGADVNAYGFRFKESRQLPLHEAVRGQRQRNVKVLIDAEADVNATDGEGRTPLHVLAISETRSSSAKSTAGILSALLENSADINAADASGNTVLHNTIASGNQELVTSLLEKGAEVNVVNSKGRSPLHAALLQSDFKSAGMLLARGADAGLGQPGPELSGMLESAVKSHHGENMLTGREKTDRMAPGAV